MLRLILPALLVASVVAVAAPVPPPSEKEQIAKQWGKIHAPSEKYEFKLDGPRLTIRTDGEPTDNLTIADHSMHVRVTKTVTGDFEATVRVVAASIPNVKAKYPRGWPASRAGIFAAGGKQHAELELLQYFGLDGDVPRETPFKVVWVNTQSKVNTGGRHVTHLDPRKPLYLRITRVGKVVSDYYSSDGKEWKPTNWARGLELPDEVTVGVYFTHTTHQIAYATFSDFTVEKLPRPK